MKNIISLYLLFVVNTLSYGQTDSLFKFSEKGKVGYFNYKGEVVIKPIFNNGFDFSEGLAPVRPNGLYGYIDKKGEFVIKPEFEMANSFFNGLAGVRKKGKLYIIDKKGKVVIPTVYTSLRFVGNKKAIVSTKSGRYGLLEIPTKKLLADTIYNSIGDFTDGVAMVEKFRINNESNRVGLIDTLGKIIVPFNKFLSISTFSEGHAVVSIKNQKDRDNDFDGVIDSKGKLLFVKKNKKNCSISFNSTFNSGFIKYDLYKHWIPDSRDNSHDFEKDYEGFMNLKGEIVLNDTSYSEVKDFSCSRAFVKNQDDDYLMIDTKFKPVGNKTFQNIKNGFEKRQFPNGDALILAGFK